MPLMIRNGKLLREGSKAASDPKCCCGCPPNCQNFPQRIDVTITDWGVFSCREDTYTMVRDGDLCIWQVKDNVLRTPNPCCFDTGITVNLDCVEINGEDHWALNIHVSEVLDVGQPGCGVGGKVPTLVSHRPVKDSPSCPPLGEWTMTDLFPGCGIPTVVLAAA